MEVLNVSNATRRTGRLLLVIAVSLALPLLAPRTAYAERYWFETYEHAVQLVNDGRIDEASRLLGALIDEYPVPASGVRVPGDRYINYHPYFLRARIQVKKGDYLGASESLMICEAFGAIRRNSRTEKQFLELRRQISERAADMTASNSPAGAPVRN